jgi:hypothetical protein
MWLAKFTVCFVFGFVYLLKSSRKTIRHQDGMQLLCHSSPLACDYGGYSPSQTRRNVNGSACQNVWQLHRLGLINISRRNDDGILVVDSNPRRPLANRTLSALRQRTELYRVRTFLPMGCFYIWTFENCHLQCPFRYIYSKITFIGYP